MKFFIFSFTLLTLWIQASGENEDYQKYAMFAQNAERAKPAKPIKTELPLKLSKNDRIALIGNTLFDRLRNFGHFEAPKTAILTT